VLLCTVVCAQNHRKGDGWEYFCFGQCDKDVTTPTTGGTILMGGGTDVDDAFIWMIKNSGGGDILVLRASGTDDAYNDYIYGLGKVNSVATFVISKPQGPQEDPFVLGKIMNSEGIWFAGGDQWLYYSWWKDTPLIQSVQKKIDSGVTVGGTSAGMAIMADFPFVAEYGGADPHEALQNPYNKDITLGNKFLNNPYMGDTTNDMHFVERDRMGRLVTFLARVMQDRGTPAHAIACDQSTAVLVDVNGMALVVVQNTSDTVNYNRAYVFVPQEPPRECKAGIPLTFTNISIFRLGKGDAFSVIDWAPKTGFHYLMNIEKGVMATVGNNGDIY